MGFKNYNIICIIVVALLPMSKLIILPVGEDAFANTEAAGEFGDPARVCCD